MKIILAIICSIFMVLLVKDTLFTCFDTRGCGTPCAGSVLTLQFAPVLFVLPFSGLLWAKDLSKAGLVARCAVTSAALIWVAAMLGLFGMVRWAFGI